METRDDSSEQGEHDSVENTRMTQHINNVWTRSYPRKIEAHLMVDNCQVKFQIDSGATCDVVRKSDLEVNGKTMKALRPTNEVLCLYDNSRIRPLGRCTVNLKNQKTGRELRTDVIVVEEAPTAILGTVTSQEMELLTVNFENIQAMSVITESDG